MFQVGDVVFFNVSDTIGMIKVRIVSVCSEDYKDDYVVNDIGEDSLKGNFCQIKLAPVKKSELIALSKLEQAMK